MVIANQEKLHRTPAVLQSSLDQVRNLVPPRPRCQVDKLDHERVGGHTTEVLALVSALDFERYTPRTYIISDGDTLSAQKAHELEKRKLKERKRVSGRQ